MIHMHPLDAAWKVLKGVDFSDLGPEGFPSQYKFQPDTRPFANPRNVDQYREVYESDPKTHQRWMEESYFPDITAMLELAALRQATGQQVPIDLIKPPEFESWHDDDIRLGRGITSREPMYNFPIERKDNPLGE